ncbi:PqiC family protein [Acetobacter conturbans]|uniref:ABC-type transport auxiliary lipoprotein component domain-containing protein n=1 Tax=Acetobacter conturbans TaxID=1737472 RepID=A0ABX0JXH7_9PROT|nr:PqiC family protein [Acetobacter conturbans]NHN87529.1 hypothetical protein [Acetobacter conturbans]
MTSARKSSPALVLLLTALSLAGCASPPLRLYTLEGPATAGSAVTGPIAAGAPVVEVRRVSLPDYLDSQDIITRDGTSLSRSPNGRWAERLSNGMTDLISSRIGAARPDLFVTEQPFTANTSARLAITISRLDLPRSGQATMEASWAFIPSDEHEPEQLERGVFTASGPLTTDGDSVAITDNLVRQLSDRIIHSLPQGWHG